MNADDLRWEYKPGIGVFTILEDNGTAVVHERTHTSIEAQRWKWRASVRNGGSLVVEVGYTSTEDQAKQIALDTIAKIKETL